MRSSTKSTREVVETFLDTLYRGQIAESFELIDDDGIWLFPGHPDMISIAGEMPKAEAQVVIEQGFARFRRSPTCTIRRIIADGTQAAVEADMDGELSNGNAYRLIYIFFFDVVDGKITRIHEHLDTYYGMKQMFGK